MYSTRAHVFQIDPSTKKSWLPCSKQAVTVSFYYDPNKETHRIISVDGAKVGNAFYEMGDWRCSSFVFANFACYSLNTSCVLVNPKLFTNPLYFSRLRRKIVHKRCYRLLVVNVCDGKFRSRNPVVFSCYRGNHLSYNVLKWLLAKIRVFDIVCCQK